MVASSIRVQLGNKVKFWEDKWLGEISLMNMSHRLYSISTSERKTIQELAN